MSFKNNNKKIWGFINLEKKDILIYDKDMGYNNYYYIVNLFVFGKFILIGLYIKKNLLNSCRCKINWILLKLIVLQRDIAIY